MREEIMKNALLAKQQQNATISVEIVGLGDAQKLLAESQATPEKAPRDEEKQQEMQKLQMLKQEEERFAYLGWGEECEEEEENASTTAGRHSNLQGSNEKRVSAIRDDKHGIEILVVGKANSQPVEAAVRDETTREAASEGFHPKCDPQDVPNPFQSSDPVALEEDIQ